MAKPNKDKAFDHQPDQVRLTNGSGDVGDDELDENELDGVRGGTTSTPAPKPTTVKPVKPAFEIKDFSFDI